MVHFSLPRMIISTWSNITQSSSDFWCHVNATNVDAHSLKLKALKPISFGWVGLISCAIISWAQYDILDWSSSSIYSLRMFAVLGFCLLKYRNVAKVLSISMPISHTHTHPDSYYALKCMHGQRFFLIVEKNGVQALCNTICVRFEYEKILT